MTGIDLNRDGIPDGLQQPQVGYAAPMQYGARVQYGGPASYAAQALTMTVTGVDMNREDIRHVLGWSRSSCAVRCSRTVWSTGQLRGTDAHDDRDRCRYES